MQPRASKSRKPGLFRSYWIAGYEGADHVNGSGHALSLNQLNQHWQQIDSDYALLQPFGIRTVRESIGWRISDNNGHFDSQQAEELARTANRHQIQVIWTLLHYGWPKDTNPFSTQFVGRFAKYCEQVARKLLPYHDEAPFYQPINEISFLSWAITSTTLIHPYDGSLSHQAGELKRELVRAALRGCEAIWSVDPRARIIHTDPVINVIAHANASERWKEAAARYHQSQFQVWDMLCGRVEPELGGSRRHLDILGLNYYHSNQWEYPSEATLFWHFNDQRRKPFSELAADVWRRYERPMFIAETSHVGEGRSDWLDDIATEVIKCEQRGIPLEGICLYPILDRPDWENLRHWHNSGLWDVPPAQLTNASSTFLQRILCQPYAERLRYWQTQLPRQSLSDYIPNNPTTGESPMSTIIVFSHLRWNFVYQRPQHLLSRLADHYQIVFMEEPVTGAQNDYLERFTPCAGVQVLRPHVTGEAEGFDDAHFPVLRRMLDEYLDSHDINDYWLWFYTPLALPITHDMVPNGIIYDCMDELTAFKHASPMLMQRENELFAAADIVFTGGPSLYQSKRGKHANVHCFASSVDAAHFAPKSHPDGSEIKSDHPAQQAIPFPRLGYFGVIDERIDIELVGTLAESHPEWQIVMVGPVVKIDPDSLPRHPNIHWLGQQAYADLPDLIAGWDLCLMPFAINEATRFISPTKTLEYMAAQRVAVSTAIKDVAEPYGHVVPIAYNHDEFIEACATLLAESAESRATRLKVMRDIVAQTSWNKTSLAMHDLINGLLNKTVNEKAKFMAGAAAGVIALSNNNVRTTASISLQNAKPMSAASKPYDTIVLGGGPTGLSAAYHLGEGCLLLERQPTVGGWCRSIVDNGFTFDFAGHIMFSNDPYVLELYDRLLGDNIHWQNREAWIYSKNVYTRYPFQGALYGLPPDVLKECVVGAIEARFGPLKKEDRRAAANIERRGTSNIMGEAKPPQNFEEFIYKVWGAGVAKHFAIPYNKKLWAVPLNEMETSWLGSRVPLPDLEEMIEGALKPVGKPMGPNARFGYPLRGGFQALMDGFLPLLEAELQLNADVVAISPSRRTVTLASGKTYRYKNLISTLPLPKLVEAIGDEAPPAVHQAAQALRHVSVRCVNLGIGRENITEKHWIYYPEDTVFHRIFVQGNASPYCNAPGGTALICEITYSEYKPLPCDGQELIQRCIEDCIRVGMIRADDAILAANQVDMPFAYVVYDHARAKNVELIRSWMGKANIVLSGRYSEWEYYNSDHAFVAGKKAADQIANRSQGKMAVQS